MLTQERKDELIAELQKINKGLVRLSVRLSEVMRFNGVKFEYMAVKSEQAALRARRREILDELQGDL